MADALEARLVQARAESLAPAEFLATVDLLIIDDLGMRKLPHTAAEDLLEVVMRRYEKASTIITSNPTWGKLLGDNAAVSALLDRILHHGHVLKCGPRSWRMRKTKDLDLTATGGYKALVAPAALAGFDPSTYGRHVRARSFGITKPAHSALGL